MVADEEVEGAATVAKAEEELTAAWDCGGVALGVEGVGTGSFRVDDRAGAGSTVTTTGVGSAGFDAGTALSGDACSDAVVAVS